jgi:RNA polymerase-binding transcription factor DksA
MDVAVARARLLEGRDAARTRLAGLVASFDDIVDAARDSNVDDEHDPEGSTIAAERSLVTSLAGGTREHLAAVDAALARLDAGTYGTCTTCGGPIGEARLEARPATATCIACA